jgi:hypothetical protein
MSVCIHCQVLEVSPRAGGSRAGASDLLPWADPYIALLMRRLEERYDVEKYDFENEDAEFDPFADDSVPEWSDESSDADGAPPAPAEASHEWYPPVYGGWPLLDDLEREADGRENAAWEDFADDSAN